MTEYDHDGRMALRLRRRFSVQDRDLLGEALNDLAEIEKHKIAEIVRREIKREPEKEHISN